jgi:hypothetical protein
MTDRYRIRWARVEVCNGYRCWMEQRCIAERRVWFGPISWWWPVRSAGWRQGDPEAARDIEMDRAIRSPLPPARMI